MVFVLISCSSNDEPKYKVVKTGTETELSNDSQNNNINIMGETTIQGCEYFAVLTSYSYYIPVHKGNCKNPIHQHIICDSMKYINRIQDDSIKISFLERKLEVAEKVNRNLIRK